MKLSYRLFAAVALSALITVPAAAAQWPTQQVTIVVPYPAGGTSDTVARLVAQRLQARLGQTFVVQNRPGASGNIGGDVVARAKADGHTLMVGGPNNFASNQFLYKNLPYDIEKDLTGITVLAQLSNVMMVPNSLPVKNLKEFVAAAKANPDTYNCASTGAATSSHLTFELFKDLTKVDVQHIPMKGSAPVVTELMGERVECAFDNLPGHIARIKGGSYRALAIPATERSKFLPDVPTFAEQGYPEVLSSSWFALAAPSATPSEVLEAISRETNAILAEPEVINSFEAAGYTTGGGTPAETNAMFQTEIVKWKRVIEVADIKLN